MQGVEEVSSNEIKWQVTSQRARGRTGQVGGGAGGGRDIFKRGSSAIG